MAAKAKRTKKGAAAYEHLLLKQKNGWSGLKKAEANRVDAFGGDYRDFVSRAKTEREAHRIALAMARENGYVDLAEASRDGRPGPGSKLFVDVGGKTLALVHLGKRPLADGMHVVGAHTDCPRLDLKPRPVYEEGEMALLDTHYYGGIKKYHWVALPLALHGVVVKKDGQVVEICIGEAPDDPVFAITDLLPHLGKDQATKKIGDAISGEGLNILLGSQPVEGEGKDLIKLNALKILHQQYGIDESDLLSAELEVVPAGPARELGLDRSMVLAYGHDDRVCAYTGLRALLDLKRTPEFTAVCLLCDKEEIGSVGATGMQSDVFENVIGDIVCLTQDEPHELTRRWCLRRSKALSADVNALHDPNYPEVSSPNENMAKMNRGLVLTKYGGSRGKSGSNDASAEFMGWLRGVFDDGGVVWQTGELGKVDQGGGGTIAHMLARFGMEVVDCGVGVLSMHAPWEIAGKLDIYMAYKGYAAFFRAE